MNSKRITWKYFLYLAVGILLITTTGIAYLPGAIQNGMYEFELTFLSNLMTGLVFLAGAIYGLTRGKEFRQIYYLNATILLVLVFLTCLAFHKEMNFEGPYLFLHVINPLVATIVMILFTSNGGKLRKIEMLSLIFFPVVYLCYAIIYGFTSGYWLYGFINIDDKGVAFVTVVCLCMAAGIFLLGWTLHKVSQRLCFRMR